MFVDEAKNLKKKIKNFLILGVILDYNFGPRKDKLFALHLFSSEVRPVPSVILYCMCRVKA